MVRTLTRFFSILLVTLTFAVTADRATSEEPNGIQNKDLARAPFYLDPLWLGGVLRLVVSGVPKADWVIRFDYGQAGVLEMRKSTADAYFVRDLPDGFEIDVPIMAGYPIRATSTYPAMRVQIREAVTTQYAQSEQKIPDSNVVSLGRPPAVPRDPADGSIARVDMLGPNGFFLGHCTAFRVARGYWLTAAHCAYRRTGPPAGPPIVKLRLQVDAYAKRVEQVPAMLGRPVASGLKAATGATAGLLTNTDLDYVIVAVDGDNGTSTIPLASSPPPSDGVGLVMLHYWRGGFEAPTGKALSEGKSCSVLLRTGIDSPSRPDLCTSSIQHGCTSQGGGSGGPLLDRGQHRLLAVHYGAGTRGKFNCGLPVALIVRDLCERNINIARKVTTCP